MDKSAFNIIYLALLLFSLLALPSNAQQFSAFKSYKDAAVKPANYGHVERRNFPIEEYLSGNQMKMLKARRGRSRPEEMFDNNWSGFKQYKDNRAAGKALSSSVTTDSNNYNWRRLSNENEATLTEIRSWSIYIVVNVVVSHVTSSLHWYLLAAVLATFTVLCYTIKEIMKEKNKQQEMGQFDGDRFTNMSIHHKSSKTTTILTV